LDWSRDTGAAKLWVTGSNPYSDPNFRQKFRRLDIDALKTYWKYRSDQHGVDITVTLFYSAGLAALAYCAVVLKRVFKRYKQGTSDLPNFMSVCFIIGAFLPAVQFLQGLGLDTSADNISEWTELPDNALQALTVSFLASRGMAIYLFSLEFVFVSTGIALASFLSIKTEELPRKHAIMGIITASCGGLAFIFEIVVFNVEGLPLGIVFGITVLLYGVIFLPSWTIWLGVELRRLKQEQAVTKAEKMDVGLTEMSSS